MTQTASQQTEALKIADALLSGEPSLVHTLPLNENQQLSLLERLRTREAPLLATPKAHGD